MASNDQEDWFSDNAPSGDPFAQQLTALYASKGRPAPTPQEIESHRGNPGGLDAIAKLLDADNAKATPQTTTQTTSGPNAWIDQALKDAQSTDNAQSWYDYVAKDPKAMAGDPSAIAYWKDRISRGDGALAVRNGTVQKFDDTTTDGGFKGIPTDFGGTPSPYTSKPIPIDLKPPEAPKPLSPYVPETWSGGDYKGPEKPQSLRSPYEALALPDNLKSPYNPEIFRAPTLAELQASPGYLARLQENQRVGQTAAAAKGSILNGRVQEALQKSGQDYASNEYGNLFGQSLSGTNARNAATLGARQENFGEYLGQNNLNLAARGEAENEFRADDANAFRDYMSRYGQFTDTQSRNISGRQQNVNEQNTAFEQGQTGYKNRYQQYLDTNARELADYITNTTNKRTAETDYWGRLRDLYGTGANLAGSSYRGGINA